ncbi:MAG: AAA family ATPase, partial [Methanobrevibacter sp.]|nr:AAA family ATPase [Methanobrevibacter sp.]
MSKIKELPWGTDAELREEQFFNRKIEIENLKSLLSTTSRTSPPTIMIPGIRGVGKTVLLKKLKKEMEEDYLVAYIDLTHTYSYQIGKLDEIGIMQHFFQVWMEACKKKKFNTLIQKIKKNLQTKTIKITNVAEYGGLPIPIAETAEDYQKLLNYVLELPQKIYEEHQKDLKGVVMIIDEFQAFEDLGDHLDGFLWFFRSIIQNQKNVAYIFSGSITSKDKILERISGKKGAFGGRMLTIEISPFD